MFCKSCGVEMPEDSKFCSKCGAKIADNVTKDENLRHKEQDGSDMLSNWQEYFFSFNGRRGRGDYIKVFGIAMLLSFVIVVVGSLIFPLLLLILPVLWVDLANDVRRFHDLGKSTLFAVIVWVVMLCLSPFLVVTPFLLPIYLMAVKGEYGPNQYGDDPTIE